MPPFWVSNEYFLTSASNLSFGIYGHGAECTLLRGALGYMDFLNLTEPSFTDFLVNFLNFLNDFFDLCTIFPMYFFEDSLMWSIIRRLIMKPKLRPEMSQTREHP